MFGDLKHVARVFPYKTPGDKPSTARMTYRKNSDYQPGHTGFMAPQIHKFIESTAFNDTLVCLKMKLQKHLLATLLWREP